MHYHTVNCQNVRKGLQPAVFTFCTYNMSLLIVLR